MSFLTILKESGVIKALRDKLKTEEERIAFDLAFEEQVKYHSQVYEDLNAKVMQYKSEVEKLNVENTEHRQPEGEEHSES